MNKRVTNQVCQFLQNQNNNEAAFATFWDKTKDFYPEDQSKTKVKQWLKEHPERFEIVAGKDGNPFWKIRLIKATSETGETEDSLPSTTPGQDEDITSKLIESIDKTENGSILFCGLCGQKSAIFPPKLQEKNYIKKWLYEHEDYFEVSTDLNGGIHSVQVTQKARKRRVRGRRPKQKPETKKEDVVSVDRVQETTSTLERVSQFIHSKGGSVSLSLLVQQKELFPVDVRNSIGTYLANFPGHFQLTHLVSTGEIMVILLIKSQAVPQAARQAAFPPGRFEQFLRLQSYRSNFQPTPPTKGLHPAVGKVIDFICEDGGTTTFAVLLKRASELIGDTIDSNNALFSWLSSNAAYFEILPNPSGTGYGQVRVKLNIIPRFCHRYLSEKNCPKEDCHHLHICKAFVCGHPHTNDVCKQSHNIRSKHNKAIINKSTVFQKCTDEVVIKILVKSCFPRVCSDFNRNKQGVCSRVEKCHFLHICGDYVLNQCTGCSLSHSIVDDSHNVELLKRYALSPSQRLSVEMVKTNIAYVQAQKHDIATRAVLQPSFQPRFQPPEFLKWSKHGIDHSQKEAKKKRSRPQRKRRGKMTPSSLDKASSGHAHSESSKSDASSSNDEKPVSMIPSLLSLNPDNISKSNLNASLSGHQKVDDWFRKGSGGFSGQIAQPTRERSLSVSSSEGSVQSSVVSSQNSFQLTELEKKVFTTVLEKYNGSAPFVRISKETSLFPDYFDVKKWFTDHPNTFILLSNGHGEIDRVNAFSRRCRVCLDYSSKKGCPKQNCGYFHVCRNLVEGHCSKDEACKFNHNFGSAKIKQLAKRFHLQDLNDAQLCKLVQLSTPNVCGFHNKPSHCNRGDFCPNIHICKKFARERCSVKRCQFGHLEALETQPAKRVLEQYQMDKHKPHYIRKMLFVFSEKQSQSVTATKTDSTEKTKVEEPEQPNICSLFLTGQTHKKKCKILHHNMPYLWQFKLLSNPSVKWCNFDESDCENIEKMFCDVKFTAAELNMATKITIQSSTPHSDVRLDFQSMSGSSRHSSSDDGAVEFSLRRLESDSRTFSGDGEWFQAQWMWYKLDESHKWIKYEANKINALEESYLKGNIQIDFSSRRRPAIFVSLSEAEDQKKKRSAEATVSEEPLSPTADVAQASSDRFDTQRQQSTESSQSSSLQSQAPSVAVCHRVKVESGTQDYHIIEKLLRESIGQRDLSIKQLEKTVNDTLWEKYRSKKRKMTDDLRPGESVNERRLFVPCRPDDVERVTKDNVCVSRLDVPLVLGPGHYFTSDASLCLDWCSQNTTDSRYLLVCQVLLGTYTEGSRNTTSFPRRQDSRFYDSLVNNITEPNVFVVPDIDQCYPAFIIDYSYTPTPKSELDDPLRNMEIREGGSVYATQPTQESLPSPNVPSYAYFPEQTQRATGQVGANPHLPYPTMANQAIPSAATTPGYPHFTVPQGAAVSPQVPQSPVGECVKAPPPYTERVVPTVTAVPSPPPPSYSHYPSQYPPSASAGYPQPTNASQVPRPATQRGVRPGSGKKDKDCVVM